jgi:UDP-glucuronate 4-epimerase
MILVTGVAGFIGFHVALRLLDAGKTVHGLDNLNDYYDPTLKAARLKLLTNFQNFNFHRVDTTDQPALSALFTKHSPEYVVHLAAQAGVRHALSHPHSYIHSNVSGFLNILEGCRHTKVAHLVYASSSSVYGLNSALPFSVRQSADHPISLYGATKKANELMAHSYSHLYGLPTTGLRFFTVYGPWGRPDMAYFLFTKSILEGKPIRVFNFGKMKRDFTYIADVIECVTRLVFRPAAPNVDWNGEVPDPSSSKAPYRVYNIGNHSPIEITHLIRLIEQRLGMRAITQLVSAQPGDVDETAADVTELNRDAGFEPNTEIDKGISLFIDWYRNYYSI